MNSEKILQLLILEEINKKHHTINSDLVGRFLQLLSVGTQTRSEPSEGVGRA